MRYWRWQPQQTSILLTDRRKRRYTLRGCLPTLPRNGARRPSPAFLGRGILGLTTTPHGDGQPSSTTQLMRPVKGFTCPPV